MSTGHVATKDTSRSFLRIGGAGQPVVFSHDWPPNADAWDDAMMFVARNGFRGIAYDRRRGSRSSQPWDGKDVNTYAAQQRYPPASYGLTSTHKGQFHTDPMAERPSGRFVNPIPSAWKLAETRRNPTRPDFRTK
jgi:pimeloyl-ACP methyl ester carboxylesterase